MGKICIKFYFEKIFPQARDGKAKGTTQNIHNFVSYLIINKVLNTNPFDSLFTRNNMLNKLSRRRSEMDHLEETLTTGTDYNSRSFFNSRYSHTFWKKKAFAKFSTRWPKAHNFIIVGTGHKPFSQMLFDFNSDSLILIWFCLNLFIWVFDLA